MNIYIDENMSPYMARGFHILQMPINARWESQIEVRAIKDVFGAGAKDETWIPVVGDEQGCVLTQDVNIRRTHHQNELCEKFGLGMFYVATPKNGITYWTMVSLLNKHWLEILEISMTEKRPFAYKMTIKKGMKRFD